MNKLLKMTESELKDYIFNVQNVVKQKLDSGIDIDDFLDETTIFDDFENIIPDEEFPIFVIAILNNYKSDVIIDKLVNSILSIKK
ncbi:MAG: hypothetical protein CMF80_01505 [Candidatus Marinimicrobia bacterium]|nr:hypothetical protein [Candidatus Neomarinimicrobiota bacterium]|tara:strand:- start:957 stop:1211 length:255 start_codon:yes stop_codon:yes gene_type:complete